MTVKKLTNDHPSIYGNEPWQICEDRLSLQHNPLSETIFALSNGYIGMRGNFEEGLAGTEGKGINGTYLNGFYESVPIPHAERGYGYALNTQTMLNVTDSKIIELYIDGERFSMIEGNLLSYKRTLYLESGLLVRELIWRSPRGKEVQLKIKRLLSFTNRHLLSIYYEFIPLNFSGKITLCSSLDGAVDNHTHEEEDPRFSASLGGLGLSVTALEINESLGIITHRTERSGLFLACAMENKLEGTSSHELIGDYAGSLVTVTYTFKAKKNAKVTLEKFIAYYSSRDYPQEELSNLAAAAVEEAKVKGFQSLYKEQEIYLRQCWDHSEVSIAGDQRADQGLKFNMFNLLQAAGSDGKTAIGAKGLSSEGYDGHYFWDTEIYLIPFYAALLPQQARNLLLYRYSILDHARSRARELSHPRGALYPWRTIAGEEGSSYYPAGTAQYHINAAIAYAINKYYEMTGDYDFILDYGAEIIFETARLWEDLGAYIPRKGGLFCYNEVTGPDEYTALVNNNCYTNLMAQWHLNFACETAAFMRKKHSEKYRLLAAKIALQDEEIDRWKKAAEKIYIPYDDELKVHPQDDSFLEKELWDFASTPPEKYPLLLHYHPLVIYRYQVCKQPDVVLAHLLLDDRFDLAQKRRDYDYYEAITTHDSSLSPSIFSMVASELAYYEAAEGFFQISSRLDLDNLLNDTHFGIHMANMAGSWLCLAYGFAGMRTAMGKLSFKPYLPSAWNGYSFKVIFKNCRLAISIQGDQVTYCLIEGSSISFKHYKHLITLTAAQKFVSCALEGCCERIKGS